MIAQSDVHAVQKSSFPTLSDIKPSLLVPSDIKPSLPVPSEMQPSLPAPSDMPILPPAPTPHISNPSTNLCTFKSGDLCLLVDGFTFSVHHTDTHSIIWKCSKSKSACMATCTTDKSITFLTDFYNRSTHNHEPPSEATYTVTPQSIAQSDAPIPQASNPSTNLCTFKSGGPCLLVDGFTYSVKRTNNDSIIWRCSKYKSECKATCSTDKNVTFLTSSKYSKYTHNHEPPSETAYTTTPQIIKTEASYP